AACVRALGKMEIAAAQPILDGYLQDEERTVLAELARYRNPLTFPAIREWLLKNGTLPGWCPAGTIRDLGPLSGLTQLQSLGVEATQVSDLGPLSGLPSLELIVASDTLPEAAIAAFHAARDAKGLPKVKIHLAP